MGPVTGDYVWDSAKKDVIPRSEPHRWIEGGKRIDGHSAFMEVGGTFGTVDWARKLDSAAGIISVWDPDGVTLINIDVANPLEAADVLARASPLWRHVAAEALMEKAAAVLCAIYPDAESEIMESFETGFGPSKRARLAQVRAAIAATREREQRS